MNPHIKTLIEYWTVLDNIKQDKTDCINIYNASGRESYGRDFGTVKRYFDDVHDKVFILCKHLIDRAIVRESLTDKEKAICDKFLSENGVVNSNNW